MYESNILFSLFLLVTGCAELHKIAESTNTKAYGFNSNNGSYIGASEEYIIDGLGQPLAKRHLNDVGDFLIYRDRWYLISNGKATDGEMDSETHYNVEYKSVYDKSQIKKEATFSIYPGSTEIQPGSIDFRRYSTGLSTVLKSNGWVEVKDKKADIIVLFVTVLVNRKRILQ